MNPETSPTALTQSIEERLALLRGLAESMELSSLALVQNDAEAIARGAAHQAELCRQWSLLEDQLRRQKACARPLPTQSRTSVDRAGSAHLQAEWEMLSARIRYLARVHCSLLRHLQRSFAVLSRVVASCANTYTPDPGLLRAEARAGKRLGVPAARYANETAAGGTGE